jgi:hypothetical protein
MYTHIYTNIYIYRERERERERESHCSVAAGYGPEESRIFTSPYLSDRL